MRQQIEEAPVPPALPRVNLAHLQEITHEFGIWQHCREQKPNARYGFSIDDEARGLIVALHLAQREIEPEFAARLGRVCFDFIEKAARPDGRYHNFADKNCQWLDSVGSDDSFGRTLWSLATACAANLPFAPRARAVSLLERSLPLATGLPYLRSQAFVIMALAQLPGYADEVARELSERLAAAYEETSSTDWRWFEDEMTYCNARLPQAMFLAAQLFPSETRYLEIGIESMDFLLKAMRLAGKGAGYAPI